VAVVAAIHGDEPCGVRAIERLLARDPTFTRPVAFVVANERALRQGRRCLDEDLNRAFPGSPTADTHEGRLAAALLEELEGHEVVTLHASTATPDPFALVQRLDATTRRMACGTGVERVVDISHVDGGLEAFVDGVAVECGLMGTDAAARTALEVLEQFLVSRDALPGTLPTVGPDLFCVFDRVSGPDLSFLGANFERVDAGEAFARRPDGDLVRADEPFYPVLMSTEGYDDMLGFRALRVGTLADE
jgi:hypothetical protein